jgi:DinB superfamily
MTGLTYATLLQDFLDLRRFSLKFLEGMTAEEAQIRPPGFPNHLHWQLGHLLYTQGETLFTGCGFPSPFPGYRDYFDKGTGPGDYDSLVPDWESLMSQARRHVDSLPAAVADRLDRPLTRSRKLMNVSMATAGETLPFLIAHEGEHIGHLKRLRRAVRPRKA